MPSLAELQSALVNAHNAGDTAAAQTLATAIRDMQGEQNASQLGSATPVERFNLMQRRMGLGKTGDTMGAIRNTVDNAGYNVGGKVTDLTGSPAAGYVANVATDAIPMLLGGGGAKSVASPGMQAAGRKLMQVALKPSKAARESGDAAKAIDTLLEKGGNVSKGTVDAFTDRINTLDNALSSAIASSKAQVPTFSVVKPIKEALDQFRGLDITKNQRLVLDELQKFIDHPDVAGSIQIPIQAAQELKRQIYKELGEKAYGMGLKSSAEEAGKKAIARGMKEGVEAGAPEANAINKEMGDLINARDLVHDRVSAAGNNLPVGLGWLNPKTAALGMAERSPFLMSLAARGLYNGSGVIPTAVGSAAGGLLGASTANPEEGILNKRTSWVGTNQGAQ